MTREESKNVNIQAKHTKLKSQQNVMQQSGMIFDKGGTVPQNETGAKETYAKRVTKTCLNAPSKTSLSKKGPVVMKGQNAGEPVTGVSGRVCVCLCVV